MEEFLFYFLVFILTLSWRRPLSYRNQSKPASIMKELIKPAIFSISFSTTLTVRSSHLEVFLVKGVLKICSKFTGEHPYRSAISIKLQSKFIEITLWHRCSPVNLLHIFRTPFLKSTSGRLFLDSGCLNSFCYFLKVH